MAGKAWNNQDASDEIHDRNYHKDDMRCSVPSCKKYRRDNPNLSFLRIPQSLKEIWCRALDRTCPKMPLYVCNEHININDDCYKTKGGKLRLRPTANCTSTKTYYVDNNLENSHQVNGVNQEYICNNREEVIIISDECEEEAGCSDVEQQRHEVDKECSHEVNEVIHEHVSNLTEEILIKHEHGQESGCIEVEQQRHKVDKECSHEVNEVIHEQVSNITEEVIIKHEYEEESVCSDVEQQSCIVDEEYSHQVNGVNHEYVCISTEDVMMKHEYEEESGFSDEQQSYKVIECPSCKYKFGVPVENLKNEANVPASKETKTALSVSKVESVYQNLKLQNLEDKLASKTALAKKRLHKMNKLQRQNTILRNKNSRLIHVIESLKKNKFDSSD